MPLPEVPHTHLAQINLRQSGQDIIWPIIAVLAGIEALIGSGLGRHSLEPRPEGRGREHARSQEVEPRIFPNVRVLGKELDALPTVGAKMDPTLGTAGTLAPRSYGD